MIAVLPDYTHLFVRGFIGVLNPTVLNIETGCAQSVIVNTSECLDICPEFTSELERSSDPDQPVCRSEEGGDNVREAVR
jgi:hypothetical protein